MKHYVYALRSQINGNLHIGMTTDVQRRLRQHNAGRTRSTKAYIPFTLIYQEGLPDRNTAHLRERYLKSDSGRKIIKTVVS